MPLHMTKIAYSAESPASLKAWLESHETEALMTTRYLPKRHVEMIGGSLYWIFEHTLIGRSPLLGFTQREDGRWHIRLEPRLIAIHTVPRRAHQGWRYLDDASVPRDLGAGEDPGDVMPARLVGELAKLGLV
jgi:hypothetical protein